MTLAFGVKPVGQKKRVKKMGKHTTLSKNCGAMTGGEKKPRRKIYREKKKGRCEYSENSPGCWERKKKVRCKKWGGFLMRTRGGKDTAIQKREIAYGRRTG